ncbi:hypothetical protein [Spiroplasma endosymbiont of Panorpa germanica]|uniref:hypothetical protein n=1 Tax=Spiroplasma endosymbiont of Panorpa germanica TaxID=3066314 RepID=UPI0030D1ED33
MLQAKITNKNDKIASFPIMKFNFLNLLKSITLWVISISFGVAIISLRVVSFVLMNFSKSFKDFNISDTPATTFVESMYLGVFIIYLSVWIIVAGYDLFYRQRQAQLFELEKRTGNKLYNSYLSRVIPFFVIGIMNITIFFIINVFLTFGFLQFSTPPFNNQNITAFGFIYLIFFLLLGFYLILNLIFNPVVTAILALILSFWLSMIPVFELTVLNTNDKVSEKMSKDLKIQKLTYNFQISKDYNAFFKEHEKINYLISDLSLINKENYERLFLNGILMPEDDYQNYSENSYEESKSFKILERWNSFFPKHNMSEMSLSDIILEIKKQETDQDLIALLDQIEKTAYEAMVIDNLAGGFDIIGNRFIQKDFQGLFGGRSALWSFLNILRTSVQFNEEILMDLNEYNSINKYSQNKNMFDPFSSFNWMYRGKKYSNPTYKQFINKIQNYSSLNSVHYEWTILDQEAFNEIKADREYYDFRLVPKQSDYESVIAIGKLVNNPFYELFYILWLIIGSAMIYLSYLIFKKVNTN